MRMKMDGFVFFMAGVGGSYLGTNKPTDTVNPGPNNVASCNPCYSIARGTNCWGSWIDMQCTSANSMMQRCIMTFPIVVHPLQAEGF